MFNNVKYETAGREQQVPWMRNEVGLKRFYSWNPMEQPWPKVEDCWAHPAEKLVATLMREYIIKFLDECQKYPRHKLYGIDPAYAQLSAPLGYWDKYDRWQKIWLYRLEKDKDFNLTIVANEIADYVESVWFSKYSADIHGKYLVREAELIFARCKDAKSTHTNFMSAYQEFLGDSKIRRLM